MADIRGGKAVSYESSPASETRPVSPGRTGRHAASAPDAPRQLPAAVPHFTGRAAELDALTGILDEATSSTSPGALVISAIGGTAGIGKTALALHWAHQVAHRFPDGQLHVNLRGFDPSGAPMPPADAICGFLDALGVPPESVPRSADAQAGLYRSLLAGKRMLIVLDNARDEQQVRPLLPASAGSLVLVTSRNQITGLAAAEGARIVTLDTLTREEAVRMLTARIGRSRAAADPAAVAEIAALCACLPLALSVVAARIDARPQFPLAALAAELRDTAGRLEALDAGDPRASVQAVFSWSYDRLSPEAARMFRLMGLHPGPDISTAAAARLADVSQADARRQLRELDRDCLIAEHVPDRYTFHDLLRVYASSQVQRTDGPPEITAARGRVLDYYAQAACAASILLYPSQEMITFADEHPEYGPVSETRFNDAQQARAWLEAEHSNLIASVSFAAESGFDHHAWQLPWFLAAYLTNSGYWNHRVPLHRTGLAAATRLGDPGGQAVSSFALGSVYMNLLDHDRALDCFRASTSLYRQLGNRLGEAETVQSVAAILAVQGRAIEAADYAEYVLRIQRELGNKPGEARILVRLGMIRGARGNVSEMLRLARHALTLAIEIGDTNAEQFARHSIAYSEQVLGHFAEAVTGFGHVIDLARTAGDRFNEADAFAHLGDLHHMHGSPRGAEEAWSRALAIFGEIQHPDADHVRAKLASPGPPGSDLSVEFPVNVDSATGAKTARFPRCSLVRFPTGKKPTSDTIQLRRPGT